ncbi:MAG: glycosyltransferase family 4 protein [Synechococcus sp.]|nr:glycosyltransferase family 4 protein [Synechococcus sp.]
MTRILVVEPAGGLWGSERALLDLIQGCPQLDWAVCCPPRTPLLAELQRRGVPRFPWFGEHLHLRSRLRRAEAALGVLRACLAFAPQAVHLNQSGAWRVVRPAAALLDLPVSCHVRIFEDAAYLAGCGPSPRRLRAIIAISAAVERELRRYPRLDSIPVHRILDSYGCGEPPPHRPRRGIACIGRITPIKGQELLLQAMAQPGPHQQAGCLIIGSGDPQHVASLQAAGPAGIRWLGYAADVPRLLRRVAVLALPSWREPLGRVILEAWDAGVIPVVFSGSGGAAEIVTAAEAGIIYHEQTAVALAAALTAALQLPDRERSRLIAKGRRWLRSHCDPQRQGERIRAVLDPVRATPARLPRDPVGKRDAGL